MPQSSFLPSRVPLHTLPGYGARQVLRYAQQRLHPTCCSHSCTAVRVQALAGVAVTTAAAADVPQCSLTGLLQLRVIPDAASSCQPCATAWQPCCATSTPAGTLQTMHNCNHVRSENMRSWYVRYDDSSNAKRNIKPHLACSSQGMPNKLLFRLFHISKLIKQMFASSALSPAGCCHGAHVGTASTPPATPSASRKHPFHLLHIK
jgi:hypothetical protein